MMGDWGYELIRSSDYPLGLRARQAPRRMEPKFVKFLPAKCRIGKNLGYSVAFQRWTIGE